MPRINIIYTSAPMLIGKTEWRITVGDYHIIGTARDKVTRCTAYQWRKYFGSPDWQEARDWPQYDTNDTYHGLPLRLSQLYRREKETVLAYLNYETPRQKEFAL